VRARFALLLLCWALPSKAVRGGQHANARVRCRVYNVMQECSARYNVFFEELQGPRASVGNGS
jgi:hypothetical protein